MESSTQDPQGPQDQRSADQDAAIEQAFAEGTLPEEDRRADAAPVPVPAVRRVTVRATARGFDGVTVIEEGERFTIDLTEGQAIPEWTTLVTE